MTDMKENTYYKRLSRVALWPLLGFFGLLVVIVLAQILVFHLKYVPELLAPVGQSASPEVVEFVAAGINKIIVNLSVWILALAAVNASLLYVVWNVRKLLADLAS